jgi:hypothetical protein
MLRKHRTKKTGRYSIWTLASLGAFAVGAAVWRWWA